MLSNKPLSNLENHFGKGFFILTILNVFFFILFFQIFKLKSVYLLFFLIIFVCYEFITVTSMGICLFFDNGFGGFFVAIGAGVSVFF